MEVLSVKNLSFAYGQEQEFRLKQVGFQIRRGELLLLCGSCGCGKTTLLRLLKQELAPAGRMEGTIAHAYESRRIGYLFQNPDSQIVCRTVEEELVFGAENLGMPRAQMARAVAEITAYLGIEKLLSKDTAALSGGQKQILNLASLLMMNPGLLLLDEPTAQLDPVSTQEFMQLLAKLKDEQNLTMIVAEHNLDTFLREADQVLYLEDGRAAYAGERDGFVSYMLQEQGEFYPSLPKTIRLAAQWGKKLLQSGNYPYSARELLGHVDPDCLAGRKESDMPGAEELVRLHSAYFRYDKQEKDVLNNLHLSLKRGAIYALIGGNGAGKSTLLSVLSGSRRLYKGSCRVKASTGMLPQNPVYAFLKDTLMDDYAMLAEQEEVLRCLRQYAFCDGIADLLNRNPLDLSGGQMQKAAIVKLLLLDKELLLLDEPVKGMDGYEKQRFRALLKELQSHGKTILFTSHDLEFVEETADECLMMFDGRIIAEGAADDMFRHNRFYTTLAGRIRGMVEDEPDVMD